MSPRISILIVIISLSLSLTLSLCIWTDPNSSTTFNFEQLRLKEGGQLNYFSVDDKTADDNGDLYNYYFNLCAPVVDYPADICHQNSNGEYYSYCNSLNTTTNPYTCERDSAGNYKKTDITGKAFAYQLKIKELDSNGNQIDVADPICYPLSSYADDPIYKTDQNHGIEFSLYDELDPSQGLKVHYSNGAWGGAPGGICGSNRELIISLKCEDDLNQVPRQIEVEEIADCKYEIKVDTIHGCPIGCGIYANSLCGSQGLCGYDFGSNVPRCFCYWGYKGSLCSQVKNYDVPAHYILYTYPGTITNVIASSHYRKNINVNVM